MTSVNSSGHSPLMDDEYPVRSKLWCIKCQQDDLVTKFSEINKYFISITIPLITLSLSLAELSFKTDTASS